MLKVPLFRPEEVVEVGVVLVVVTKGVMVVGGVASVELPDVVGVVVKVVGVASSSVGQSYS